ncbi:MAG: formylglycine-generating enzyme family protein, partial [Pseudomonadota bacterium]
WEWVEDCWHATYAGAPADASPWFEANGGDCSLRVVRGGSWNHAPGGLRSAIRIRVGRGDRHVVLGFRVARTLTP